MQGVAGEQRGGADAVERLFRPASQRHRREPREAQRVADAELTQQSEGGTHRREGPEQRRDQIVAQPLELRDQPAPRRSVAGRERVERLGSDVDVPRQGDDSAVTDWVSDDQRCMCPAQAPPVEPEPSDDRRGSGEWVERAEQVVAETGCGDLGRPDCATGLLSRLDDDDGPAGVGQHVGRDQAVRPGPDHHGVGHAAGLPVTDAGDTGSAVVACPAWRRGARSDCSTS